MKRRILLADDDEGVRKMVGRVLESDGYEILFARTGSEAMNTALEQAPDLVILDIGMPDKTGWEAYELIDRGQPLVPVIVITARPNQHEQALRLGIEAFMEKPLNLNLLLQTIRELLDKSDLERAEGLRDSNSRAFCLPPGSREAKE